MAISPREKVHYVNNQDFLKAISDYKKLCMEAENSGEPNPKIPNFIGECIYKIATRCASRPNFSGYTYKDDMISDGLENAIQALGNFDPDKGSNPFAYFTQIIWFAFLRRIDKEKKQMYIKHKVVENSMLTGTMFEKNDGDSGEAGYVDLSNDYMSDFVRNYENTLEKKKILKEKKKDQGLEQFYEE
jgi:hypothetical protein